MGTGLDFHRDVAEPMQAETSNVSPTTAPPESAPATETSDTVATDDSVAARDAAVPLAVALPAEALAGAITGSANGLVPAAREPIGQPDPPPSVQTTDAVNESGCNTDATDEAMRMTIPEISYACPVQNGGQAQIDDGFVTLMTDAGSNAMLATQPGDPGTLWLAAHRSTHGGPFADVPTLADGATITITAGGRSATYRVVARAYVEVRHDRVVDASGNATEAATWQAIVRADGGGGGVPRLLLQTCDGNDYRWMVYADLVTT